MEQLLNELNESLGKTAYATDGLTETSFFVLPSPDYDFFAQTTIEAVITFCRNHKLRFLIDLENKHIDIYEPLFNIPSVD